MLELTKEKKLEIYSLYSLYFKLSTDNDKSSKAIIILSQSDIDSKMYKYMDKYIVLEVADTTEKDHPYAFTMDDAQKIKNFLDETADFENLYVCCDSGQSRSTAAASAIMRLYGKSDKEIWQNPFFKPNTLIYKTLCHAFGKRVSKLKMLYLCHVNDKALKKTMYKGERR